MLSMDVAGRLRLGAGAGRRDPHPRRVRAAGGAQDAAGAGARALGAAAARSGRGRDRLLGKAPQRGAARLRRGALRWRWAPETSSTACRVAEVELDDDSREVLDALDQRATQLELLPPPTGFVGELRPYQVRGLLLAGVPAALGLWRLSGRRHGPGQDHSGHRPVAARASDSSARRRAHAGHLPHLGGGQLAARGGPLCARAAT